MTFQPMLLRMRYLLLLWMFTLGIQNTHAQLIYTLDDDAGYVTKLENDLAAAPNDSVRAFLRLRLSMMCRLIRDTAKARNYLETGRAMSRPYPFLNAVVSYYEAIAMFARGDLPAIEQKLYTTDSLLQRFDTKDAARFQAMVWQNLGTLQQHKGNEQAAMEMFVNKALVYAERSDNLIVKGGTHKSVGIVFLNAEQRSKAAYYLQKSVNYIENAPPEWPTRLEDLTEVRIIAAENYVHLKRLDSAKLLLDKAKSTLAIQPKSNLYLLYYGAEGVYQNQVGRYKEALASFDKGIAMGGGPAEQPMVNRLKGSKVKALLKMKDYNSAIALIKEQMAHPQLLEADRRMFYQDLSKCYAGLNNSAEAYKWAERFIELTDSVNKRKVEKEIAELETKYDNAGKQKKITLLESEKEKEALAARNNRLLNWLLASGLALLLLVTILLWLYLRNNRKLLSQKEQIHQQQLKEAEQAKQIQFTNALLLGEERERKRLAADLHDGLGGMLAGVKINLSGMQNAGPQQTGDLPKVIGQLDNAVSELRRIARNMMPESLLNSGLETALKDLCESMITGTTRVDFQAFDIDSAMPQNIQATIYRIVQELLTNAHRHAYATSIMVQCSQNGNAFFITVEDNGRGFDEKTIKAMTGIGLTNVRNRVEYLKGEMEISSAPNEGTTVNIELDVNAA
jgi:two-component system, NarL family, sensor kinase